MSIFKVARLGHPVIRKPSLPVNPDDIPARFIQDLIDQMIETMHEYEGVGLAAPQVHVSKQIAVIEVAKNRRYPHAPGIPLTVLINPRIVSMSEENVEGWEGCLSIPDLRGIVPRSESLVLEAMDRNGKKVEWKAEGFFARVIQHEWDHLEGRVYLDRMTKLESLTHLAEFERFWAEP